MTLAEFLNGEWLPEVRRVRRPATATTYAKMVSRHIVPALGGVRLRDLGRDDLRKF